MGTFEGFTNRLLADYEPHARVRGFCYSVRQVSRIYGIPEEGVPKMLDELESAGLIELSAFDGHREKSRKSWGDCHDFFYNTTGGGIFKITRTAAGAEFARLNARNPDGVSQPAAAGATQPSPKWYPAALPRGLRLVPRAPVNRW